MNRFEHNLCTTVDSILDLLGCEPKYPSSEGRFVQTPPPPPPPPPPRKDVPRQRGSSADRGYDFDQGGGGGRYTGEQYVTSANVREHL